MTPERLRSLLSDIARVRILVVGDFCLDAYWFIDPTGSELSVETGKRTNAVKSQAYSLGAAGNVAHNLVDLGVKHTRALGVIGDDIFGRELTVLLEAAGVDPQGMVVQEAEWDTPVYGKPYLGDEEQRRIDFGRFNRISHAAEQQVLDELSRSLSQVDAVLFYQQLPHGLYSSRVLSEINRLVKGVPDCVVVTDSRNLSDEYEAVVFKVDAHEAARMCGDPKPPDQLVLLSEAQEYARAIHDRTRLPVFVTRGARGCVVHDGTALREIPGIQILRKVDPVGAGDTFGVAVTAALAAGATPFEAAELANFAASVTVQKLRQTGTASPAEVIEVGSSPDYVYHPEMADDPRRARYLPDTEIEIVNDGLALGQIRHAIFDHDGTISSLREGWEHIMEPVMVRSILGEQFASADEATFHRVGQAVRDYIDKSTGIQTILQMERLVEMVAEFGLVPHDQILDKSGYKEIYNEALLEMVDQRVGKLGRGELNVDDVTVKGAVRFLSELRDRGLVLYLASGTDREDVIREARVLGYADLFGDRIYGAVGDVSRFSKRMVVQQVLKDNALCGPQLACFGDGPVELRETKKMGGVTVGIASDEVRRYGLNQTKRSRLIKAGADLIIPDFSQAEGLLKHLFGG